MVRLIVATVTILLGVLAQAAEPTQFFREHIGLTDSQIALIDQGKPVAKILPSSAAQDVIVFGAVFIKGSPDDFVKLSFDMERLRKSPSYHGAGRLSDLPTMADLNGFTLEPDDIKILRSCKPGKCGLQLPAETILDLQRSVDWSAPAATAQVNYRVKEMALQLLQRYQKEGNRALGAYGDKAQPFNVEAELRLLLDHSNVILSYLPELKRYLLDYPNATLPNSQSVFFWEKVSFGLKPTLRLNHAVAYQRPSTTHATRVVMVKQLYASHYLQLALDLSACVPGNDKAKGNGFYLISVRGSTQQGLTGFLGSIARSVIVSRARSSQEKLLLNIKTTLEAK